MRKLLLLCLFGLGCFYEADAQQAAILTNDSTTQESVAPYKPVRLLLSGSFEFGGDEVAKVYFTNGDDQSVKAGQGVSAAVGAEFRFRKVENLLLRATVGYKYVTTQADNVHIRLTRIPLHFTANCMATDKIRLGAGIVTHQAIKFNADGIGENLTFKAAAGPVFEVAYSGIGLSYTIMKYQDNAHTSYAANAIGVTFSGVLPRITQTKTSK
ncbi:hypothetical protein [Pontibacter liquoris]|uniref:hypothetical protein n=1 Tax=Pontibacter liquoris TaxID=2905677 RepID=UPI001FA6CB57|nr:hypothetical protein [Pontibacter liquoris]